MSSLEGRKVKDDTTWRVVYYWNSLNASSGVYLVRMETSGFSDVRKVVLMR
jgi:hypothetical protein